MAGHARPRTAPMPPPVPGAIWIPLTKGQFALIDEVDAHLAKYPWVAHRSHRTWYAERLSPGGGHCYLHRAVLGVNVPVDHRDGNGLDCRRKNLRVATVQQNGANRGAQRNNTSGFKGVHWHKRDRRWGAEIRVDGKLRHLGNFSTPDAAARAYDAAARQHFGEFAYLNFPDEPARAA